MITLTSLGGAGTVTGSKHMLESDGRRLLVDCGLFQGLKALRERNWAPFPIDPATIDGVVLTHAHLDHCGYLPKLVKEGFRGQIFATPATGDLAEIILLDSAHIQEKDAEFANRRGFSKHKPALPLYGVRDAERTLKQFSTVDIGDRTTLPGGAELILRRAGHILGAATAEIRWGGKTMVFSGDLGRYGDAVMVDPEPVAEADYLVIESTYGNRKHEAGDPTQALGDIIERTTKRGGTVIIPTFAVGRAQSLMYHLWKLRQGGRLGLTPIYLDSPMAINATDLLHQHRGEHRLTPEECEATCGVATYLRDVEESKAVTASPVPKVILAASGMATGGRVVHHLKAMAPNPRNTILLAGYQAAGTRGAALVNGAKQIKIHGDYVPVRAEVASLGSLSAHADREELLRWVGRMPQPPKRVFVTHGESVAADSLRIAIQEQHGWACTVPEHMQAVELG